MNVYQPVLQPFLDLAIAMGRSEAILRHCDPGLAGAPYITPWGTAAILGNVVSMQGKCSTDFAVVVLTASKGVPMRIESVGPVLVTLQLSALTPARFPCCPGDQPHQAVREYIIGAMEAEAKRRAKSK